MRLLGAGDNVVDRYRDLGQMFPGGNALNVAVAAARAGARAAYIGALGSDRAGTLVLAGLRAEGVETDRARICDGPNAYADVTVIGGERVFLGGDPTVSRFRLDGADLAYAATFDLVHTGDCSMLEEQVADLAAAAPVSFDFSTHREPDYLDPILPHLRVACFSASDLDEEGALALLDRAITGGARLALATRGIHPALLFDGRHTWRQPVCAGRVVDTLGAGDSFIGRFLVGVLAAEDAALSLERAAEAAAQTCDHYGAFGRGSPLDPGPAAPGSATTATVGDG